VKQKKNIKNRFAHVLHAYFAIVLDVITCSDVEQSR